MERQIKKLLLHEKIHVTLQKIAMEKGLNVPSNGSPIKKEREQSGSIPNQSGFDEEEGEIK